MVYLEKALSEEYERKKLVDGFEFIDTPESLQTRQLGEQVQSTPIILDSYPIIFKDAPFSQASQQH